MAGVASQGAGRKSVLVINTGGTASMKHREEDGRLDTVPGYLSERILDLEELKEEGMPNVVIKEYVPLIDSSHMEPSTWVALATDIERNYYEFDGFVVVMGTDTMAYASSAVSFLMENLGKPVVFTGSQIPYCKPYTDCRRNLLISIILASSGEFCEVGLFFENTLLRANRAVKFDSFNVRAFQSPNCPPLAVLATGITWNRDIMLKAPVKRLHVQKKVSTEIMVVKLVPGFDDTALHRLIDDAVAKDEPAAGADVNTSITSRGPKVLLAIVLEVYGSGGAPYHKRGLQKICQAARERGILVVAKSQCLTGSVLPDLYAANSSNTNEVIVSAGDMTTEAVVTKLAYLFGQYHHLNALDRCRRVRDLMLVSLRGEVSPVDSYQREILAREPTAALAKL